MLGQEPHEQRAWEPDDVEVVALDPLDETRTEPLDRVAAGPVAPLLLADVARNVPRRERPEGHARRLVCDLLPRARQQADPRDDLVRPSRERLEHLLCVLWPGRLAERAAVHDDRRVDP